MSSGDWEDSAVDEGGDGLTALNALSIATPAVKLVVEGALMAAGGPLTLDQLLALYPEDRRPARDEIRDAVAALTDDYADRGIELVEVAGGWRIQVRRAVAPWVARLWEEKPARYSRALLETLALIAYRQPITRGEIEEIRGVAVSTQIVKTLTERGWVRVVGHRDVPGRPALYATTRRFLDYFGLRSLNDLPPLAELRDPAFFGEQLDAEAAAAVQAAAEEAAGVQPTVPVPPPANDGPANDAPGTAAMPSEAKSPTHARGLEPQRAASPSRPAQSDPAPSAATDDDEPR
jgi:segregation and condensation protein B